MGFLYRPFNIVGWSGASEASDAINLLYSGQIFTRVGTYVQHGSKFCFVVVVVLLLLLLGVTVIAQNIALLANFTMHCAA
jgi:hypothetical protein